MDRRAFIMGAVISQIAPLIARAQAPGKVSRVGVLSPVAFDSDSAELGAFRQRLADLGWVAGRNPELVLRDAGGQYERLPDVAAELVRIGVDVIVTITTPGAEAAKRATATIPIVMAGSGDPVQRGLVASLARPGGNITGLTNYPGPEFAVKQLQLLKEAAPRISRIAVLMNSTFAPTIANFMAMQAAGRALGVIPVAIEVPSPGPFDPAVILQARGDALYVSPIPPNWADRKAILNLAATHRLPALYGEKDWIELGGLMSYWTDWVDLRRQAAGYVDKILKGAKPADLPVEQPTKFELVINLKTAKALGITIPPAVLARADEVIQ
jgi:putative ABC transport system substrate-binding protein